MRYPDCMCQHATWVNMQLNFINTYIDMQLASTCSTLKEKQQYFICRYYIWDITRTLYCTHVLIDMLYTHRLALRNYANIMNHKNKPKFAFRLHSVIYNYCWIVLRKFTIKLKCKSLSSINHFTVRQYFWSMKDKCSHYCHFYKWSE